MLDTRPLAAAILARDTAHLERQSSSGLMSGFNTRLYRWEASPTKWSASGTWWWYKACCDGPDEGTWTELRFVGRRHRANNPLPDIHNAIPRRRDYKLRLPGRFPREAAARPHARVRTTAALRILLGSF